MRPPSSLCTDHCPVAEHPAISIGNVPLAAALWSGGLSFGGVVAFLFADLITFPLLLIYRKYYGGRLTGRILLLFWAVVAAGGLMIEGVFSALGLVPAHRPSTVAPAHFQWNYTTFLNLVFLVVAGVLHWLYRHRERLGGGAGYAIDPVCGMPVRTSDAPARAGVEGQMAWFCSDHCRERFVRGPARLSTPAAEPAGPHDQNGPSDSPRRSPP